MRLRPAVAALPVALAVAAATHGSVHFLRDGEHAAPGIVAAPPLSVVYQPLQMGIPQFGNFVVPPGESAPRRCCRCVRSAISLAESSLAPIA